MGSNLVEMTAHSAIFALDDSSWTDVDVIEDGVGIKIFTTCRACGLVHCLEKCSMVLLECIVCIWQIGICILVSTDGALFDVLGGFTVSTFPMKAWECLDVEWHVFADGTLESHVGCGA